MKVLVSSLQENDLQNFLPDIVNGILIWSSMSRHHFRSKVCYVLISHTTPQRERERGDIIGLQKIGVDSALRSIGSNTAI